MSEIKMQDEEFWRQLELLSLQFISSSIPTKIEKSELTCKRKDGGYDGQIVINITNNNDVQHTILFESKFRTSIKTLPLDDCSKALIIAFNRAAQTLYIVTNILFSPQALREIEDFKRKVNLIVIPIDGNKLKSYISENREKLLEDCSEDFLRFIETSSDINFDIKIDGFGKKQTINTSSKIIQQEEIKKTTKKFIYINSFFENEHQKYINNIKTVSKFTLISGEAGIGKTFFLTEILNTLITQGYSTALFDLQQYATPRILFIKLLESLWEIDLSEFISKFGYEEGVENLKSLIEYNSNGKISENLLSAVIQAICRLSGEIKGYTDNYYFLLTKYIYLLLKPYENNNSIVWAFTNLNKAEVETLDFLYALLCRIQGIISIVIEIRPEFTLDTVSSELVRNNYYKKFRSISNTPYIINFEQFSHLDAHNYLKNFFPNMSDSQIDIIIGNIGTLPLYLNTVANYIKAQSEAVGIDSKVIPDQVLESWISEYEKHENNVIVNSLSYFKNNTDIYFCFGITSLLDGCLPIVILENLFTAERQDFLYEELDRISFYKFKKNSYYVKHNYIYDAMKDNLTIRLRSQIARKIYECSQNPSISFEITEEKEFELLYFMQEYEMALEKWFSIEDKLYKEHLYTSIIKYGNIALKCYDDLSLEQKNQEMQLRIITSVLNSYIQIRILDTEQFNQLLLAYKTISNLKKYCPNGNILRARYLFYEWNKSFYGADIENAYNFIVEAKKIVDEKNIDDVVLCANIYWAYALSHKRKSSIVHAIKDFEEGLKKYPNSTILNIGFGLHCAHTYLRLHPEKSEKICEELLDNIKEDDCSYHEILQTRIDIVMYQFYSGQYEKAMKNCEEVMQIACSVNASYQMGRLYNIYAAGLLMLGDIDGAVNNFFRSYNEFQESGNHLFAWRAVFNLSQIMLKQGQELKAEKNLKSLLNNEIPNLKERIQHLTLENAELVAFLYTVRILKQKGQYSDNETTKLLHNNKIYEHMLTCDDKEFFNTLDKLSYMHQEYLIILG